MPADPSSRHAHLLCLDAWFPPWLEHSDSTFLLFSLIFSLALSLLFSLPFPGSADPAPPTPFVGQRGDLAGPEPQDGSHDGGQTGDGEGHQQGSSPDGSPADLVTESNDGDDGHSGGPLPLHNVPLVRESPSIYVKKNFQEDWVVFHHSHISFSSQILSRNYSKVCCYDLRQCKQRIKFITY